MKACGRGESFFLPTLTVRELAHDVLRNVAVLEMRGVKAIPGIYRGLLGVMVSRRR